jgi:hypothetical protein
MIQPQTPHQIAGAFGQRHTERQRELRAALSNGQLRVTVNDVDAALLTEPLRQELDAFNEAVEKHFAAEQSWAQEVQTMLTTAATTPAKTTATMSAALKVRRLDLARQWLTLLEARGKLLSKLLPELESQLARSREHLAKLTADTREKLVATGFNPPGVRPDYQKGVDRAIDYYVRQTNDVKKQTKVVDDLAREIAAFQHQRARVARDRETLLAEVGAALSAIVGSVG